MRTLLSALALSFLVSGCGLSQQARIRDEADRAKQAYAQAEAECSRRFPEPYRKPVTPAVRCHNEAMMGYRIAMDRSIGDPHFSRVQALAAKNMLIADQYDQGKMTEAEYAYALTKSDADTNAEIVQADQSAAVARASQQQAAAAQQMAAVATAPQPPIQLPPVEPVRLNLPKTSTTICDQHAGQLQCRTQEN